MSEPRRNQHKVPIMRRAQALQLATEVATKGWQHHEPSARMVEYWEKKVPSGELHITESTSWLGGYDLEHIDTTGRVTRLGRVRGQLTDAKVAAVLEAAKRGFAIVNPRKKKAAKKTTKNNGCCSPRRALPNKGKPKKKWAKKAVKRPGKLGGKGFATRPVAEQKTVLRACVREYGYRSCLGSLMFIHNINKSPAVKTRMRGLMQWMGTTFRDPGPRKNPPDGSWQAVPILIGHLHVHVPKMKLSAAQLSTLQMETA